MFLYSSPLFSLKSTKTSFLKKKKFNELQWRLFLGGTMIKTLVMEIMRQIPETISKENQEGVGTY